MFEQHYKFLRSLLPHGKAWEFSPLSFGHKTLRAIANEFVRLESAKNYITKEIFIQTSTVILSIWESILKISKTEGQALDERRANVISKLSGKSFSPSKSHYYELAKSYQIIIKEFMECVYEFDAGAGSAVDSVLGQGFEFTVIFKIDKDKSNLDNIERFQYAVEQLRPAHIDIYMEVA